MLPTLTHLHIKLSPTFCKMIFSLSLSFTWRLFLSFTIGHLKVIEDEAAMGGGGRAWGVGVHLFGGKAGYEA